MSEFKGTYLEKLVNKKAEKDNSIDLNAYALGIKDSKASEMLEMLNEVCENLALQLDRLGVCGEGDDKGRKADADSYGGTELLYRAKQLIKQATEL